MKSATSELISWLGELDQALLGAEPNGDGESRLDALLDQGVSLLAGSAPTDPSVIDAQLIDRVHRCLQAVAEGVTSELDAVRRARRNVTRAACAWAVAS